MLAGKLVVNRSGPSGAKDLCGTFGNGASARRGVNNEVHALTAASEMNDDLSKALVLAGCKPEAAIDSVDGTA